MAFVEFRDVCKTYRMGSIEVHAVADMSFDIEEGELCVIVGPSGAGKTTVLNVLGGMDACTSGSIRLAGREVSGLSEHDLTLYRRHDIGFVFQFYNLVQNLTALENVELASQICTDPLPALEVLDEVGLASRKDMFPTQLSGGEQQRVAIARAIVNDPAILIADEPTGNLDPETSWDIMDIFKRINAAGTTIVMATHDKNIVDTMQRRVVAIEDGKIVRDEQRGGYGYEN